ncbi:Uma2 family endonuclease [Streptomyces sp. NPDC052396]|uniref:Uma2 family endonuclease n=1 Tax=Streptomyces sp. NPDC052396 TaxID=3365689 RepID=UPI0037CFFA4D
MCEPRQLPLLACDGEPELPFDMLCSDLELTNEAMPDGYRAEIIGGKIVCSPWTLPRYGPILDSLVDQLSLHEPAGHSTMGSPHLYVFPRLARGYGPDVHVADDDACHVQGILLPGSALSLAAEVTSPATRFIDLTDKLDVYGRAGVPVYVLVDTARRAVTVYSDPSPDRGYRAHTQIKFGDKVAIPAPFNCELDTVDWEF